MKQSKGPVRTPGTTSANVRMNLLVVPLLSLIVLIRTQNFALLPLKFQPALTVKARVTLIRSIDAGVGASYGHRFISERPTRLAVVGIGYADGVVRSLSGKIHALHNGRALPQVGAITMDQLLLDASQAPELDTGSSVTLLGCDGDRQISPQHWSAHCDSIPWEILCGFKQRPPRIEI